MEKPDRNIYPCAWGLLGQWFCIKIDATTQEQRLAIQQSRESLGPVFLSCPDKWIADRFYGGFFCANDPTRTHVYFNTGQYSRIAAERGRFWANTHVSRQDTWAELFAANTGWQSHGPWSADAPKEV